MTAEEFRARQQVLLDAIETGVEYERLIGSSATEGEHLRASINLMLCEHAALIQLLLAKGIITQEEVFGAQLQELAAEVHRYEERLSRRTGTRVSLN
jgi:hypothetical protein